MHRFVLADDAARDLLLHLEELLALAFEHLVDRHARPARDDLGDVARGHRFVDQHAVALALRLLKLLLERRDRVVGKPSRFRVIALALRLGERVARGVKLFLEPGGLAKLVLLGLPAGGQRVGLLLQLRKLAGELLQAILGGCVGLLLQRLLLDLELHDAAIELVELLGLGVDLHPLAGRSLVDQVDRLVRQEPVGDVAIGQSRRGDDRRIGDAHAMMGFVSVLQAAQDRDRVLDRRLGDEHRLEAPRQRRVLFDMLAVLVERGRADAVQFAARERRLQKVRSVHRAIGLAGPDERMHLVDEQDDAACGRGHLVEHALEALLELAAIFRASNERAHIEREQLLVFDRFRHVAVDDAQRKALDDRSLADAGLADQHRIVLRAPRQHLHGAADLLVAADHRIELAGLGGLGQVAGVFLQRVILILGAGRVRGAALADVVDRSVERLGRDAGVRQNLGRLRALLHRERKQKPLDGDERVARLLGDLLGIVEQARRRRRHIELPGPRPFDLGQFGQGGFDLGQRLAGIAARPVDQPGGQPLLVVQKHLEHVLGRELLMPLTKRQRLRGLHEAARPFGVFL